jgi:UDP-3-O-[3-hydroxymyristoyl] glucosamine N-acyltransferase
MSTLSKTISELAAHIGGRVVGDGSVLIERVAGIEAAGEGDIAFVADEKFFAAADASRTSCLIVPQERRNQRCLPNRSLKTEAGLRARCRTSAPAEKARAFCASDRCDFQQGRR